MATGDLLNYTTTSVAQSIIVITSGDAYCICAMVKASGSSAYILTYRISGQYGTSQTLLDRYDFPSYAFNGSPSIVHLAGNIYAVGLYSADDSPWSYRGYTFTIDNDGTITLIQGTVLYTSTSSDDMGVGLTRVGTSNYYIATSGLFTNGEVRSFYFPADGSTPSQIDTLTTNYAGEFVTPVWCAEGYTLIYNFNAGLATVTVNASTGALGNSTTDTLDLPGDSTQLTNGNLIKIGDSYYGLLYRNSTSPSIAYFVVVSVASDGTITLVDSYDHQLGSTPAYENLGQYSRALYVGYTSTDYVIKLIMQDNDDSDGYEGTLYVDRTTGEISCPGDGAQFIEDNCYLAYSSNFRRLYTGGTDIGVYWCGRADTAGFLFAFDESDVLIGAVYPTDDIRVSGLVHRYNRNEPRGYTLEILLGGLESNFGIAESHIQDAVSSQTTQDEYWQLIELINMFPELQQMYPEIQGLSGEEVYNYFTSGSLPERKPSRAVSLDALLASTRQVQARGANIYPVQYVTDASTAYRQLKAETLKEMEKLLAPSATPTQKKLLQAELKKLVGE